VKSKPIVLLVDGDAAVRASLSFWLDLEGFSLQSFDCGQALLGSELLEASHCLIVDQRLPDMAGIALLAELRARSVTTPAILMVTHPQQRIRDASHAARAVLVEKPLISNALVARIHEQLGRVAA
jgi:two-component system C4-dicarboxylate transport response regulator DctD